MEKSPVHDAVHALWPDNTVGRDMRNLVLHALNADGEEVLGDLFTPLFVTLAPGFEASAEELRVEVTHSQHTDFEIACSYIKGGSSFCMSVAKGYHPSITSSRIRILCGMSIMPDVPRQDGKMTVRFGERTIGVNVQVIAETGRGVMVFRPIWDAPAANKTVQRTGASRLAQKTKRASSAAGSRR